MNLNISRIKFCMLLAFGAAGAVSTSAATHETNVVNLRDFSAFKIVTERNIFDPNRQPVRPNRPTQTPRVVDSFALTGTMSYDQGIFAVFDGTSSDYHKLLGLNGKIAGYSVTEIAHDHVKLSLGTNEIELKVGMQMRRSPDGKWSAAARGETSFAFNSNSRSRDSGRSDRRNNSRDNDRFSVRSRNDQGRNRVNQSERAPVPEANMPATEAVEIALPPEMGNLDPNDPVARLMLRRLQETGGGDTRNEGRNDGGQDGDRRTNPDDPQNSNENSPEGSQSENRNSNNEN
jgi:hypothetical protein